MRTHTQAFKDGIKQYGRQFNDSISVTYNNATTTIQPSKINRIEYSVDTSLLKSVMQTLVIDTTEDLNIDSVVSYTTSLNGVNNSDITFNNFNIVKKEEQKDKKSYIYTCYDNMIKAMVDYEGFYTATTDTTFTTDKNYYVLDNGKYKRYTGARTGNPSSLGLYQSAFPLTIRDYLIAICSRLGLTFKNASDTFTNYNKNVTSEHYVDVDGNKMGYTFRDVLDDLAECVGGFICIDNLGQLEIRYITQTLGSKNLFPHPVAQTLNGVTFSINDDGTFNLSGRATANTGFAIFINNEDSRITNGETYTFSCNKTIPTGVDFRFEEYNNDTWKRAVLGQNITPSNQTRTGVANITGGNRIRYNIYVASGTNVNFSNFGVQIEKGNTKTNFDPYYDTINEEYFNDKNVNLGKLISYNTLVLSRGDGSDNIYRPTTLPQEPIELKISDNAILEQDNREDFIDGIFNKINGLEFYLNDFATTGILYYEIGDKYNVSIGDTIYPCLMLSDNIKRTTGLKENIYTNEPKQSVTDFKYSSTTDKVEISSRNAKILVDKANASIEQIVEAVGDNGEVTTASIVQSINDSGSNIKLNADKIYINGVTFDSNQKMTMTDGDIEIIDNGTGLLGDSHITITSGDSSKLAFLTSMQFKITQEYDYNGTTYISGSWIDNSGVAVEVRDENNTDTYYTFINPSYIQISNTANDDVNIHDYSGEFFPNQFSIGYTDNNLIPHFYFSVYKDQTEVGGTLTTTGDTTIGGKVYLGQNGIEDYSEAGFTHDQYGNWRHKRNTSGDAWSIQDYNGNNKFTVYPESGDLQLNGYIRPQSLVAKEYRPSTPNFDHQYYNERANKRFDIVSSSMDSSGYKPSSSSDGWLETYFWDNSGNYDTQLYIPNSTKEPIKYRTKNGYNNWQNNWKNIASNDWCVVRYPRFTTNDTPWTEYGIIWDQNSLFTTSDSDLFELTTGGVKCNFTGAVLIIRECGIDYDGEFDFVDQYGTNYMINGKAKKSVTIETVTNGDIKQLVYVSGASQVTFYSTRLMIMRIQ